MTSPDTPERRQRARARDLLIHPLPLGLGFELGRVEEPEEGLHAAYKFFGAYKTRQIAEEAACHLCLSGCDVWYVEGDTYTRVRCMR